MNVSADWTTNYHVLIAGNAEGAVVLRQSFIEPNRSILESVFNQQVRVFVKDDRESILLSSDFR